MTLFVALAFAWLSIGLTGGLRGGGAIGAEPPKASKATSSVTKILIIVGPSTHPPGSHEVAAGGRLMAWCLENVSLPESTNRAESSQSTVDPTGSLEVVLAEGWPDDESVLDQAATVVFIGDTFPPQRMPGTDAILAKLGQMMDRGCGIVCVHYATGLWGQDVPADGSHPLLEWMGGYFANKTCPHHQGTARIYDAATITPASPEHPISRGWKEFTLHDEPYTNNYFGGPGNRMAANVTALATSMLPPENPKSETVAWCVQRQSGRGFGIVMPHFYKNWSDDDLRCFILNGIVWTAGLEVPKDGVQTELPGLETFDPASVKFKPRR